jgi:hypothetical protein
MIRIFLAWILISVFLVGAGMLQEKKQKETQKRHIDVVFAIDVSGSMERIITAAQKKIWAIVNELVSAKPTPELRVGLIAYRGEMENCYGGRGFKVWDLSSDLDKVYQILMKLKTGGGNRECVGRAIYEAVNSISWSKSKKDLKVLFILGNEPANQDSNKAKYGYKVTAPEAIKNDIMINTIYCGNYPGVNQGWREIARLADGAFAQIGIEGKVISINTPMDKELAELNARLTKTYIPYGAEAQKRMESLKKTDKHAAQLGKGVLAERALARAGKAYEGKAKRWDLVEASKDKDFKLEEIDEENLPEQMRKMNLKERKEYIQKMAKEREEIKKKILELSKKRQEYIRQQMKKMKLGGEFDRVIIQTLKKQAGKKGFRFEK